MQQIELHCRECNMRLMDYMVSGNDDNIVLQGIVIKCPRCKRVMILKRYTEGMLKEHTKKGKYKV